MRVLGEGRNASNVSVDCSGWAHHVKYGCQRKSRENGLQGLAEQLSR
jgi:hypothetical protein